MALITKKNTFSAGATILSAEHNENFDTVYNLVNGNIENDNIKSSAAIADTKLAQITTASKVSGTSLTGLASTPAGAGSLPIANLPYIDDDTMATASDTTVSTSESIKAYTDTQVATTAFAGIKDYGTSGTTATDKDQSALIVCMGIRTVSGGSSATVTNLPFTSNSSFYVSTSFGTANTPTEAIVVIRNSGSQITIYNSDNLEQAIHWIAIGT